MAGKVLSFVILHLFIQVCIGQVSITTIPKNLVVLQSEGAKFECRAKQSEGLDSLGILAWQECITPGDGGCHMISIDDNIIYVALNGDPVRAARYSITSNPAERQFDLMIKGDSGVLLEDGGKYSCESRTDSNMKRFAELIVLESDPVCTRNTTEPDEAVDGTYIKMSCSVTYQGRWSPVMDWQRNNKDISPLDIRVVDVSPGEESTGTTITYSYTLPIGPYNNGDIYKVFTHFNTPDPMSEEEATNELEYEHRFYFNPLNVWYPPKGISITPMKASYTTGEILYCTATSNPAPSYQWTELNSTAVLSTYSLLTITEDMLGYNEYTCTAYNQYGNSTKHIAFTVYLTEIPLDSHAQAAAVLSCDSAEQLEIAVGVTSGCLGAAFIGIIYLIIKLKRLSPPPPAQA